MTSDYRVSPQRSSSTIVSRLLRDLFRSSPATTPRESSTSSACVASIVNELSGNQARSAVADPTPPSHLRAPDFSGPPTSDVYSQSIGSIRLCSSCSSSCSSSPRIHVTFFPNKFLTPSSTLLTLRQPTEQGDPLFRNAASTYNGYISECRGAGSVYVKYLAL